jgi:hypothetical protein
VNARVSPACRPAALPCYLLTPDGLPHYSGLHLNEERKKVGRNKRSVSGIDEHAGNGLRPYPGLRPYNPGNLWGMSESSFGLIRTASSFVYFDPNFCTLTTLPAVLYVIAHRDFSSV